MTPRELSERVRASNDPTIHAISKLTRGLAHKLAGENASFEDFEAMTLAISRESDRLTLLDQLHEIEGTFGDAVKINGQTYVRHEPGDIPYHSLCGMLKVARATYRLTGVRNGPTVVPLDLAAGLIERGTPALAKAVALGYAKHDMRDLDEDLQAAQRLPPSRATMERMARQIAADADAQAPVIERAVRLQERLPDGAHGIVIVTERIC